MHRDQPAAAFFATLIGVLILSAILKLAVYDPIQRLRRKVRGADVEPNPPGP